MKKQINEMYAQINEHKNYLKKTDYQVIKEAELGYEMLDDIRYSRQFARDEINRLGYEVTVLEEQLKNKKEDEDEITE